MKPSLTKNLIAPSGQPYCVVELGDILFFGGTEFYEVTNFTEDAHPLSGEIDIFNLWQETKICPIVLEK